MQQRVLVIGATGGVGTAVTRGIVAAGGSAFLAGRDAEKLAGLGGAVGMPYGSVEATDPDSIDACADAAVAALGGLDGIVNCAGSLLLKPAGGAVVLVSSAAARVGLANHEAIAAAKAGLIGLVLSAAATYAKYGVRFNAVAPGLVRTPLTKGLVASELAEKASVGMHPLGRLGEPEDVARAICFLLDPAQSWITGQVLGVDGGLADLRGR